MYIFMTIIMYIVKRIQKGEISADGPLPDLLWSPGKASQTRSPPHAVKSFGDSGQFGLTRLTWSIR